jgi:hypothetical protein
VFFLKNQNVTNVPFQFSSLRTALGLGFQTGKVSYKGKVCFFLKSECY